MCQFALIATRRAARRLKLWVVLLELVGIVLRPIDRRRQFWRWRRWCAGGEKAFAVDLVAVALDTIS